jgi:sugar lactone lactonase YvrE
VSSCCFGGPAGTTLFITTSQEGMDATERAAHAQSGKVFCVDVETPGRPAAAFGAPLR